MCLCSDHHTIREQFVTFLIDISQVVISHDIQRFTVTFCRLIPHRIILHQVQVKVGSGAVILIIFHFRLRKYAADCRSHKTGAVKFTDFCSQFSRPLCSVVSTITLCDLISDRVCDHTRVIPVTAYHVFDISRPPLFKIKMIVQRHLAKPPYIKCLIHQKHTDAVTYL